jgi:hypothetical protein
MCPEVKNAVACSYRAYDKVSGKPLSQREMTMTPTRYEPLALGKIGWD